VELRETRQEIRLRRVGTGIREGDNADSVFGRLGKGGERKNCDKCRGPERHLRGAFGFAFMRVILAE
jgi:hypothetical protein